MKIYRFRNVVPGTELEFHPQLNVLLGRNGTGKTTLLRWLADILSGATKNWAHEPYDVELEIQGNEAKTTVRVKNEAIDVREQFPERLRHREPLAAEWAMEQRGRGGSDIDIRIETPDEHLTLHATLSKITFLQSDTHLLDLDNWLSSTDFLTLLLLLSHKEGAPLGTQEQMKRAHPLFFKAAGELQEDYYSLCRFDESLGFFHRLVRSDDKIDSIHLWLMDSGSYAAASGVMPRDLKEQLERQAPGLMRDNPSTITFRDTDLSFLKKAKDLFGYSAASMTLSILNKNVYESSPSVSPPFTSYDLGELRFLFERFDGSSFGHDQLSYGQKRALSFLYYLASNPVLIVVDELVNGLHHAWIEACRDEIGDRQAVLTSQNPLLLDHIPFESPEDVRQRFILCSSRRKGTKEELVWRNPSKEEAESFFSAYAAGIQHVGEILMDKGLW